MLVTIIHRANHWLLCSLLLLVAVAQAETSPQVNDTEIATHEPPAALSTCRDITADTVLCQQSCVKQPQQETFDNIVHCSCVTPDVGPDVFLNKLVQFMLTRIDGQTQQIKKNHTIAFDLVNQYMSCFINQTLMARFTLLRDWAKLDEQQQHDFIDAYIKKVVSVYADAISDDMDTNNIQVKFLPIRHNDNSKRIVIKSILTLGKGYDDIPVDYRMAQTPAGMWKLYDISVNNISMVKSYRSQFSQLLKELGAADFIKKLQDSISSELQKLRRGQA